MSINFHLPDFCGNYKMNLFTADLLQSHPEYFYPGVKIASSYGCFPPAAWNGGRTATGAVRREFIDMIIKEYNSRGIPIRYSFTNPLVTEKHLADPFCNMITRIAENGLNEIIVNVPVLEKYIREKYPQYPLISSTVKQIEDLDGLTAEMEKDYKLVVLDYNFNNRFDELEKIPHKEKAEILINPYCSPKCRRRKKHYEFLGERQFEHNLQVFGNDRVALKPIPEKEFPCPNMSMDFYETVGYDTHVTPEQIFEKYVPMGFENFKIEGRMLHPSDVLESYVYYLIKPEHRDPVRLKMYKNLLGKRQ
ncbi:MAG: hypothetical protein K2K57_08950 [Oscillospiraceae bacterium]|nr:hypothetical protein [Oscillospiraceae bacterium]